LGKELFSGKPKLTSTGFCVPSDFPLELHNKIHGLLVKYKDTHSTQWLSFGCAWNGLAHRYRAMDEYHEEFMTSIKQHGNSTLPEERFE
jgi:hypothetical protein